MSMTQKANEAYQLFSDWIEKHEDKCDNAMIQDLSKVVRLLEDIAGVENP